MNIEILTFILYFSLLIAFSLLSYHRLRSDTEFVLGNRSMSFWLTALSAHASDMSNWLFMGYPALIFSTGLFGSWAAIGLIVFMFLNWQFIAPRIRRFTEKNNDLTINAFFESVFKDTSAFLRVLASTISILFFVIYISAGLIGMGYLVETLFNLSYFAGITIGLFIVVFYVILGGYLTVAWIDLFQGFFLLGVILLLPMLLVPKIGGWQPLLDTLNLKNLSLSLLPDLSSKTFMNIFFISFGWGLGYLGQPHILTKFMGIKKVEEMRYAKYVGISWQTLALGGATLLGLIGVAIFPNGVSNPELVVLEIVKSSLSPFFAGLVLCAILAATTNVMAAQILVVGSCVAEDFYFRLFNKKASHKKILKISRFGVLGTALVAYILAFFKIGTIYDLVLYAWSGLGASFGPLVLLSLYWKKIQLKGAIAGICIGALIVALWPLFPLAKIIPPLVPAFTCSLASIYLVSLFSKNKQDAS